MSLTTYKRSAETKESLPYEKNSLSHTTIRSTEMNYIVTSPKACRRGTELKLECSELVAGRGCLSASSIFDLRSSQEQDGGFVEHAYFVDLAIAPTSDVPQAAPNNQSLQPGPRPARRGPY